MLGTSRTAAQQIQQHCTCHARESRHFMYNVAAAAAAAPVPYVPSADLLSPGANIEWVVVKGAGEATIPITEAYSLTALLTPTPRWPDAMCVIDPVSKVVFTSKLFSAHVAPGLISEKVSSTPLSAGAGPAVTSRCVPSQVAARLCNPPAQIAD